METKQNLDQKVELTSNVAFRYNANRWYKSKKGDSVMYHSEMGKGFGLNEHGCYVKNCSWMANEDNGEWEEIFFGSAEDEKVFEKEFYTNVIVYLIKTHHIYHIPHIEISVYDAVKSIGGMEKLKRKLGIDLNISIRESVFK